ncbi:MAG TPA: BolA family protein [Steroidobacteraceae bacterium]|nr:BolA family protein [Steroidobacteraceae bacterium]
MNGSATDAPGRIERMRNALAALAPVELEIVDESHLHAGHDGAKSGRGHYRLRIVSQHFAGLASLARHRAVYAALGKLMSSDIHALTLEALTPAEAAPPSSRILSIARGSHEA